jgi:hypothetical protein
VCGLFLPRYNLAGLAKRQGKHSSAEACYAEALDIFRAKLGDSEGETADTMYQMGCLYRKKCVPSHVNFFSGSPSTPCCMGYAVVRPAPVPPPLPCV